MFMSVIKNAGRLGVAAALTVALAAGGAFAQKLRAPGTDITVSKTACRTTGDVEDCGMYNTIQAAVNAAKMGQVIEILDTETYAEQVTIDGRETSPWTGVTGGKNGITIRYVPAGGAAAAWNHTRPTIRWRDEVNVHPVSSTEAKRESEINGAGNFETNGALRVLRAKGVTIEGIAVDGGRPFAFGAAGVWCGNDGKCSDLNHGNAAITLAVAGQVTIRDCDLKNAFFGIQVKDRNTGGVFGNPNPADNDTTVPLSAFGLVGGHLFEYNKINANVVGVFFESAWDLGSSVRYNLVFNNKKGNITTADWGAWKGDGVDQKNAGAFMFKDMYLSPVAIYNNTLYDNTGNFIGHWQAGGQHLIFNNIFSVSTPSGNVNHMSLDGKFPFRMNNCVFSADVNDQNGIRVQGQSNYNCDNPNAPGGNYVANVQVNGYAACATTPVRMRICNNGVYEPNQSQSQSLVLPGAALTATQGDGAVTIGAGAGLKWLQTEGFSKTPQGGTGTYRQPSLFKSLNSADADFLVPNWEDSLVIQHIKNKGWETAGIRNSDGELADLGAIPSTGVRQSTVARILPTNVVLISGSNATANFNLRLDNGNMTDTKIKMLRWIAPIPVNTTNNKIPGYNGKDWPGSIEAIASNAIRNITTGLPAVGVGNNTNKSFTVGSASTNFGFFEIIIEGKDANGKTVTSDVGFLPYRQLEYFLDIEIHPAGTSAMTSQTALKEVQAGVTYRMRVTARHNAQTWTTAIKEVVYSLLSSPTAFIYNASDNKELLNDLNKVYPQTYNVYFKEAGDETIFGSGLHESGTQRLVFIGTLDIKVRPGPAHHVVFTKPIPKPQVTDANAPIINSGVGEQVTVEVQDKFGNAVDVAAEVSIAVTRNPTVGDAGRPGAIATKTVQSVAATGVATFEARVTGGKPRDVFDMTATLVSGPANNGGDEWVGQNVGTLRVGRSLDRLEVFYSDNQSGKNYKEYFKPDVTIDAMAGEWVQVTVKVVGTDTVITTRNGQSVYVEPSDPALKLSATSGGSPATTFPVSNGVATLWVSADVTVGGACLDVYALNAGAVGSDDRDGSVGSGNRCGISFTKPEGSILRAVAYGDGQGRPDSLRIYYSELGASFGAGGGMELPTSVTFEWPSAGKNLITSTAIAVRGDFVLQVDLRAARGADFPTGFTRFTDGSFGRGNVKVYGGEDVVEEFLDVYEAFGPVLTNNKDAGGNPQIVENKNAGVDADTIKLNLSEQPRVATGSNIKLLYLKPAGDAPDPAAGGTPLTVLDVQLDDAATNAYTVVVAAVSGGLHQGDWIRLDPDGELTDRASQAASAADGYAHPDNKAHAGNRWVQLREIEAAPSIKSAYYTSNYTETGYVNFVYVEFDKPAADFVRWFLGGTVYFDASVAVTEAGITNGIFKVHPNPDSSRWMIIDLSQAYKSYPKLIRTGGDMAFRLGFGTNAGVDSEGKKWGDLSFTAKDGAKPVLAEELILKVGSLTDDGKELPDTLTVVYSERLASSLTVAGQSRPVTLFLSGDVRCTPVLSISDPDKQVTERSNGFLTVTYVVDDIGCPGKNFPAKDDYARINIEPASVEDRAEPVNRQDVPGNLKQTIRVERGQLNWVVKVKNNPFRSGSAGESGSVRNEVGVSLKPGAKGAERVNIKATVTIYDNLGSLVLVDTLNVDVGTGSGIDEFVWNWKGHNKKGRLVGTGTYLFRAVCDAEIMGEGDKIVDTQRYSLQRPLGVVRGKGN